MTEPATEAPRYTPAERKEMVDAHAAALEGGVIAPSFALKELRIKPTVATGEVHVKEPENQWTITVGEDRLKDQTQIVLDAIADINHDPPFLFHRSRQLVRINFDERGTPLIEVLTEPSLRGIIERCCDFVERSKKDEDVHVPPPKYVVQDIMSLPKWNTILPLIGVIECPTILIDTRDPLTHGYCRGGRLLCEQGYDKETQIFYAPPPGFVTPIIPDQPTEMAVADAVNILQEIFKDFPFIDTASRTNTIAALITAVLRPSIPGAVPLFLLNKNMPGTGATLVCDCIATVTTGKAASIITAPTKSEEWAKMILATLMSGRTLAVLDNLEDKLYSPKLAALLTSKIYEDRVLGLSKMVSLPHRICWVGNGINVKLGGDLGRRCYMANMSATVARPWQRDEAQFSHPNLIEWVSFNRSRIIGAILTLTRNWIIKGRPEPKGIPKFGGFEGWRNMVGGIIVCSGMIDFLGNLEEMYEESDVDTQQWGTFFERWFLKWNDTAKTASDISEYMRAHENATQETFTETGTLLEVLPDELLEAWEGKGSFTRVLGNRIAKREGNIFINGLKIVKHKELKHGAVQWKVVRVEKGEL